MCLPSVHRTQYTVHAIEHHTYDFLDLECDVVTSTLHQLLQNQTYTTYNVITHLGFTFKSSKTWKHMTQDLRIGLTT